MTSLGAMRASIAGLAAEMHWPEGRMREAIHPMIDSRMLVVNEGASFLWVRNFLRYNEPEGPNSVKAWVSAMNLIPECPERIDLLSAAYDYLRGRSQKFINALPEGALDAIRDGIPYAIPDPGAGAGLGAGSGAGTGGRRSPAHQDERRELLIEYAAEQWINVRGCTLKSATTAEDLAQYDAMIERTADDPAITAEALKQSLDNFLESSDVFHQSQGFGYWCRNATQFLNPILYSR